MGEGGGFPRVRAVVSLVNPGSSVACPNTKGIETFVMEIFKPDLEVLPQT
jgi:hypothetical protein